jgi:OOP family OmpA-OmpF porin
MLKKVLGISVITASLFATSINNKLEVGVGAGYMDVEHSNKIDNYGLINVRIGKYLKNNNVLRVEFEDGDSNDLKRALLNMEHDFKLDSKITPYAYLGTGMEWVDKSGYDQDIVADFGLGAKYALTKKINIFLEARVLRNFSMNDNHYGAIAGINYEFGENKEVAKSKPKVVDSDYDGIDDNMDKCPNTPAGVKVDTNGCPIDSDHDGVADYLDKCPNTPAGVKVDTNGCPIDSDHDGVADYLDKCPNTPAGVKVDTNGCPLTFNLDVHFKTNSAEIIGTYMTKVNEFVKFLKENPAYKAEIEGYTDNRGSKQYNIKLSEKRAKAVYDYLIKSGISADRLSYKGYGPANPIADNNTKEGRKLNRRVVSKLSLQ